jgi:prepilin peptidase CpaA
MAEFLYQWVVILFAVLMGASAIEDYLGTVIPNRLTLAMLALYPAGVALSPVPVDWVVAFLLAMGAFAVGAGLYAVRVMGGGDVKLFAVLALWAGPTFILDAVLLTVLTGGVVASVAFQIPGLMRYATLAGEGEAAADSRAPKRAKQHIPYGIAIAAGGLYVAARLFWGSLA